MTYRLIHRPARTTRPLRDLEEATLEAPPVIDQSGGKVNLLTLVPLIGAAASMTLMMLFRGSPFAAIGAMMMIVTVLASVVLLFTQRGKARREREIKRESYLEYLDEKRRDFTLQDQRIKERARLNSPEMDLLPSLVRDPERLWERRRSHRDFLSLRIGTGARPARHITVATEERAIERPDYFLAAEVEAVTRQYEKTPGLPFDCSFDSLGEATVVGPRDLAESLARQIIVEAAVFHSPEDVEIALIVPEAEGWAWVALLPHTAAQDRPSAIGPAKRIYSSREDMASDTRRLLIERSRLVAEAKKNNGNASLGTLLPRLLVLDLSEDSAVPSLPSPDSLLTLSDLGVTCLRFLEHRIHEPESVSHRLTLTALEDDDAGAFTVTLEDLHDPNAEIRVETCTGELVTQAQAETVARLLSPLRLSPDSLEHSESSSSTTYTEMLGLSDLAADEIERMWEPRSDQDFLRIPLGPGDDGKPVLLDLKEAAQFGMGPHGLCVGATGSGKSELLRTIVLALMVTHAPDRLSMVLVDFKGGATFAPFEGVPHVSGIITNLSEETSLIDRVHDSLAGEIRRRQEILKQAGNIANITDYELFRREAQGRGEEWDALPHLLVIIDEFGELLTAQPDFIDLFLSIGRIGRSIGVHLMLSSQRIESGKLRGLETYLSYRLGLRTLSEAESRTVLDTPDAFHLPGVPGYGYLKVDTTIYDRFRAGYVSGPLPSEEQAEETGDRDLRIPPLPAPFSLEEQGALVQQLTESKPSPEPEDSDSERTTGPTVMSHLVDALRTFPRATSEIWLDPLPDALTLDRVTGPLQQTGEGVQVTTGGELRLPIGLLDDPSRQWQGEWFVDLTRAGGSLSVIGGPQTGKSTALRTLALSAALTHSPAELAIYAIDLKGSSLLALEALPNVGGVGVRTVRENVRRTVEEVHGMLAERERIFETHAIDSLSSMRRLHARGEIPELPVADVVLMIDGYGQLADEFDDIETLVHEILARGSGYGVHVIATATRWNEIRIAQQAFFGNKIEFRLSEPAESAFGKKKAEALPANKPGRALQDDSLVGHVALPRMDGAGTPEGADDADPTEALEGLGQAFTAIAEELTSVQDSSMVPPVRVLPQRLTIEEIDPAPSPGVVPLGLVEQDFTTRQVDLFGRDRHLLVLGDSGSGKTSILRAAMARLAEGQTEDDIVFALFDPRQELGGVVPEDLLGGHAKSALLGEKLAQSIAGELAQRVPQDPTATGPVVVPHPRIILVLDDYDVLTSGGTSPLGAIAPYVSMSSEIGLHILMTRKVAGAARGLFEPFTAAVRESGAVAFLMDGDRTEGALINGVRARHFPPGRGLLIQGGHPPQTIHAALDPSLESEAGDP
jgi:S-DNA-T family DNA segregation ATPase FtsK/SpoIIIE